MTSALPQLDPLLHQPVRTQVVAFLAARGEATFAELKRTLGVTDGNLDAHLGKLLAAGYVASRKETAGAAGRPATVYCLTATGRTAFTAYVAALGSLLGPTAEATRIGARVCSHPDGAHAD